MGTKVLINAATITGALGAIPVRGGARQARGSTSRTFQAWGTTTAGSGAASILIQVSNDGTRWLTLGTINLTLSTSETNDGFASAADWPYVRGNVNSISGTGAAVSANMGGV